MIAPVGHTSRQGAFTECLQTSDIMSQVKSRRSGRSLFSMNLTCRQFTSENDPVVSEELPVRGRDFPGLVALGCSASSAGGPFHGWHATWQALQPMHTV